MPLAHDSIALIPTDQAAAMGQPERPCPACQGQGWLRERHTYCLTADHRISFIGTQHDYCPECHGTGALLASEHQP